jgi:hypothetical protein
VRSRGGISHSGHSRYALLTVVGQSFRAKLAQAGAILFQTRQNGIVTVVDHGAAMSRHFVSASRIRPPALLR